MSKLTLGEAIKHCLETVEQWEERANTPYKCEDSELQDNACRECAAEHRQLAEWLTDYKELKNSIGAVKLSNMKEALKLIRAYKAENIAQKKLIAEYKRLLKAAVEDMTGMQFGEECKVCSKKLLPNECPIHNNVACILEKDFKWRYADEVLALIREDGDKE